MQPSDRSETSQQRSFCTELIVLVFILLDCVHGDRDAKRRRLEAPHAVAARAAKQSFCGVGKRVKVKVKSIDRLDDVSRRRHTLDAVNGSLLK